MKRFQTNLFMAILALCLSGCYRNDVQEVVFSIPKLSSEECSGHVLSAISGQEGILQAHQDLVNRTLTVKFNARITALKNIEYAIAEAGFDINEEIGRKKAKSLLPETCR